MLISCQFCRQKIETNGRDKSFVFGLGDLINGEFYEKETYYYHLECLNTIKSSKRKKKVAIGTII